MVERYNKFSPTDWSFELLLIIIPDVGNDRVESPLLSTAEWEKIFQRSSFNAILTQSKDVDIAGSEHPPFFTLMLTSTMIEGSTSALPPVQMLLATVDEPQSTLIFQELSHAIKLKGFQVSVSSLASMEVEKESIYFVMDVGKSPCMMNLSSEQFKKITTLLLGGRRVFWFSISSDLSDGSFSNQGMVTGLTRVARAENEELQLINFSLHGGLTSDISHLIDVVSNILFKSFGPMPNSDECSESEYIYRNDQILVPRLIPDPKLNRLMATLESKQTVEFGLFHQSSRALKLHVATPGLLDSLLFVDDTAVQEPIGPNDVEICVQACGVNFKDVFVALGQLKPLTRMGGESSGIVTNVGTNFQSTFHTGDRVCGFNGTPCASRARVAGSSLCLMPNSMSYAVGASVTAVFATAVLCLIDVANMQKEQSILIHAAAGGVGQAAIMVAKHLGVQIYATVGTAAKRRLLIEKYGIPESNIFSSRSRTFKKGIMRLTNGVGVDVVLNSLSGEALQDSWDCVASFGYFLEIGKVDVHRKTHLDMQHFDRNLTFAAIDLVFLADQRPKTVARLLAKVMDMFVSGVLAPVQPISTMPILKIEDAFRLMQTAKHIGKVVLECDNDVAVELTSPPPQPLRLEADCSYLIAGGLGDLGLKIVRYVIDHGAKHVICLTRKRFDPAARRRLETELNTGSCGARVYIYTCDINDQYVMMEVITSCKERLPPIRGVIQAAMVLQVSELSERT